MQLNTASDLTSWCTEEILELSYNGLPKLFCSVEKTWRSFPLHQCEVSFFRNKTVKTPHKWSDVPRVLHECRPALVLHITQRLQSSLNLRSSHTSSRGFSPRYQHGPRVSLKFGEAGGSLNLRRSIFQNHISGYNIGGHLCSLFIPELKVSEGRRAEPSRALLCSALLCSAFTKRRQRRLVLPWWAHGVPQLKNSTQSI